MKPVGALQAELASKAKMALTLALSLHKHYDSGYQGTKLEE